MQVHKRNHDIQSSLNIVEEKPQRTPRETPGGATGKNASGPSSLRVVKGQKTPKAEGKLSTANHQQEPNYTLSQNSINCEAASVEI